MPQAIDRLLATPRIKPRLPRKRPEASGMIFLAAPPTASLPMTQGKGPHKQPPFAAIFAPSSRGNMVAGKVFVRVIWLVDRGNRRCPAASWEGECVGWI